MAAAHKLFLVDSSVTIQRVIELTFAGEDMDVVTVSDGEQAIARISIERPDIVLADIGVLRRNGYEVAAFIKGQSDLKHIPVLLLAGAFEPVDEAKAEQAGADGVLVKPFEPQHVITRVRELLASAKARGVQSAAPVLAPTASPLPPPVAAPVVPFVVPAEPVYVAPPEPVRVFVPEPISFVTPVAPRVPPVVAPAISTPDPGLWPLEQVNAKSLDDYFSRLDAAFSTMGQTPPPPAPFVGPDLDVLMLDDVLAGPSVSIRPVEPIDWADPGPLLRSVAPAPPLATAHHVPAGGSIEANVIAAAFTQMLAAEQGGPAAPPLRLTSVPQEPVVTGALIDEIVGRVMDKVMEKLSSGLERDIVERVVSDVSERLVREEIARIRGAQ